MAKLIANTANMPHGEWLKLRKEGIGGSDAAAVAGVSKYANPVTVYMEKLNLYSRDSKDHVKESAYWGNTLEEVIRNEFKRRINLEREEQGLPPIKVIHRKAIFAHEEHDFIRTNLDGWIPKHEKGKGIFEAKTAHYMLREEWEGEDVPNAYFIQVQHNMMVMNADFAYLAVLIGGNTYKHYYIERDYEFCDLLKQLEVNFWQNHILTRIPPEMTGHDAEKEMLASMYPDSEEPETPLTLPNEAKTWLERVEEYKGTIKTLKESQSKYENMLKDAMKEAETAYAGPHKVTWKTSRNGQRRFTYKLNKLEAAN